MGGLLSGEDLVNKNYLPAIILNGLMVTVLVVSFAYLPQQVPLWFTYPWGEGQLANKLLLWGIPSIGILVVVINSVITRLLPHKSELLKEVLRFAAAGVNLMLLISIIGIVQSLL